MNSTNTKEQEDPHKFQNQKIYGESLKRDTPLTEKNEVDEQDGMDESNFKMMPQRDRGPSKYFDKVTDLFDIDDELNQRHHSTIISDPSDDENSGEYSKASRH